jgi:hypothetical protein
MRDDPHPSRYYPRLDADLSLDAAEAPASPLPPLAKETKGLVSALFALYLLVAILFAVTNRAQAAPLAAPEAAAAPAFGVMGEGCMGEASLALK